MPSRIAGHRPSLSKAILLTIVYADLFDYPLTSAQVHRYLPRVAASLPEVERFLAEDPMLREQLDTEPPYWFLAGREAVLVQHSGRAALSRELWPKVWRIARIVAAFPFVRMVACTGSLAMDNVREAHGDVDLLLVARKGRVWFVRGSAVLLSRLVAPLGIELCPNYIIADDRLALNDQDIFTAHELAQSRPLYGYSVYERMMGQNPWLAEYLPNAQPRHENGRNLGRLSRFVQSTLEWFLAGRIGDRLERWERERKISRLRQEATESGSCDASFGPDVCKGHKLGHGTLIRQHYLRRLEELGLSSSAKDRPS